MSHHSILPHEFHSLSQQNSRLNQNLISITLNHETLLQENTKLTEQLKKKEYSLIESTLREKNLQHNLKALKTQYTKLQTQFKELDDWMHAEKKLQMRDIYKKESQMALDLTQIERQSYRESRKSKNEQLNLYQERIIELVKENDLLKLDILQITSEYNDKIYTLKNANLQSSLKLKRIQSLSASSTKRLNIDDPSIQSSDTTLQSLQQQMKLQNTREKLQFYMKENAQLTARNIALSKDNQRLIKEVRKLQEKPKELSLQGDSRSKLQKLLNSTECSLEFITQVFDENNKLRKEIEQTTNKYVLLTETYPKLVDDFQAITELEENLHKFEQVKRLQHELSQSLLKATFLQESLTQLQTKFSQQLSTRQTLEYKTSILTKRFNEIFIRMNPFFDIYQYESLELDENMWKFFDEKKDYRQLKEYENRVLAMRREAKEQELNYEKKERGLRLRIEEIERGLERVEREKREVEGKLKEVVEANMVLRERVKQWGLAESGENVDENADANQQDGDEANNKQPDRQLVIRKKLENEVTVPLLEQLINRLQQERESLLQIVYKKDQTIIQLTQQLHSSKSTQSIQTIRLDNSHHQNNTIPPTSSPQPSAHLATLLQHHLTLEQQHSSTIQSLTQRLQTVQHQLNQQHNIYQLEIARYEREYQQKLVQVKGMLDGWVGRHEELKVKMQVETVAGEKEGKKKEQKEGQAGEVGGERIQEEGSAMIEEENGSNVMPADQQALNPSANLPHQQPMLPFIPPQPSHSNLDKLPTISHHQQQGTSNKLIGESTVQTLTSTLKKYEHQMTEVLSMCAKLSQQYSQLKKRVKNQEELQSVNAGLREERNNMEEELKQTKKYLEEKNRALTGIEQLYKAKSKYCEELKSGVEKEGELWGKKLEEEKKKTELLQRELSSIKDKFYQLASRPQTQSSSSIEQPSLLNTNEFQTIVVMHANKNKEITQLSQKNTLLQNKVQKLMQELNVFKLRSVEKRQEEVSPIEKAEIRQLSALLKETDVVELVRRANAIVVGEEVKRREERERVERERKEKEDRENEERERVERQRQAKQREEKMVQEGQLEQEAHEQAQGEEGEVAEQEEQRQSNQPMNE